MSSVVDVEGLTSEWLSEVLEREVVLHSSKRIGTGQTGASCRLEITAEGLPSSLVAKVAAGDDAARFRVKGGYKAEVGFYAELLATVDVRAPQCWYAAVADDGLTFTVLLEDLAPREPGVQANGCSVVQAEDAVRNLAGLHAPRWNDTSLHDLDYVSKSDPAKAGFLGGLSINAVSVFGDRFAGTLSEEDLQTLTAAAHLTEQWMLTRPEPFSVLHGDYRLDNLMFGAAGDVVAVDWQTLMSGPPARDLAYFLGTCLEVEVRRAEEKRLVGTYHDALIARGVSDYTYDQCFDDYRLGQLQGPMITMIGAAFATAERTPESDRMFLAMARRTSAAIRDLGSLDLL